MINSVKINDTTLFKCLLQSGANVNAIDSKGNSALTYAAGIGNFEIIKYLIENGANVNAANPDGKTILIFAAGKKGLFIHTYEFIRCFHQFVSRIFSSNFSQFEQLKKKKKILIDSKQFFSQFASRKRNHKKYSSFVKTSDEFINNPFLQTNAYFKDFTSFHLFFQTIKSSFQEVLMPTLILELRVILELSAI